MPSAEVPASKVQVIYIGAYWRRICLLELYMADEEHLTITVGFGNSSDVSCNQFKVSVHMFPQE